MAFLTCPRQSCHAFTRQAFFSPMLANSAKASFSTATRPTTSRQPKQQPRRVPTTPSRSVASPSLPLLARHASTTPTASQTTTSEDILTWDRFFQLRRRRRFLNLGSSAATAFGAVTIFGPILAQQDIDGWAASAFGIDPMNSMVVLGVTTFAVAATGWLCGPSFGGAAFKIWAGRRGWNGPIAEKERSFYARVKRYRADPSSSSPQNPLPDYYGEKIASVKDYRRWLKDQRAFNLKKNKNMV